MCTLLAYCFSAQKSILPHSLISAWLGVCTLHDPAPRTNWFPITFYKQKAANGLAEKVQRKGKRTSFLTPCSCSLTPRGQGCPAISVFGHCYPQYCQILSTAPGAISWSHPEPHPCRAAPLKTSILEASSLRSSSLKWLVLLQAALSGFTPMFLFVLSASNTCVLHSLD